MLIRIKKSSDVKSWEITDKNVILNRRAFMQTAAAAAGAALLPTFAGPAHAAAKLENVKKTDYGQDLSLTSLEGISTYNNFYEFGTGKDDPSKNAHTLEPKPWTIEVTGLANKTGRFGVEDLIKPHQLEERIYRMRCVEAWSMVIPWVGIPLASVLKQFDPQTSARFVAFETLEDTKQMPAQKFPILPWPYKEGLTMREAMHPLTLLAVGIHGEVIPNQNGAPIRLVVPWKYGFKGIKSIVKIEFTDKQPPSTWEIQAPSEYGFYSNVNPKRDHPRWSQKRERRITGAGGLAALLAPRVDTLMFNGYAEEVAGLYEGMDLMKFY